MSIIMTETDLRQSIRSGDALTASNDYNVPSMTVAYESIEHEDEEESFLPANRGVTGHEPNTNPPNWLTNHRRMPPHRPPVPHPQWITVGGPLPMRLFLWNMFCGCQILQWSYSMLRATGLHDHGIGMYQIANEW